MKKAGLKPYVQCDPQYIMSVCAQRIKLKDKYGLIFIFSCVLFLHLKNHFCKEKLHLGVGWGKHLQGKNCSLQNDKIIINYLCSAKMMKTSSSHPHAKNKGKSPVVEGRLKLLKNGICISFSKATWKTQHLQTGFSFCQPIAM